MVPMYPFLERPCANILAEVMIFEFYYIIGERGIYFWQNEAASHHHSDCNSLMILCLLKSLKYPCILWQNREADLCKIH
jgi:hypothetical protein